MKSMIQKRLLLPNRVRRPPDEGFSWVDRRFLQDYAARLSRDAILLYFFFTAVSDQQGLSFYSDSTIAVRLRLPEKTVSDARAELVTHDLIAWQRPVDRFAQESRVLRPLPGFAFDTDEVVPAIVSSHARVHFDENRYSVPPKLRNTTVMIRASDTQVRVIADGEVAACHPRNYDLNQVDQSARPSARSAEAEKPCADSRYLGAGFARNPIWDVEWRFVLTDC